MITLRTNAMLSPRYTSSDKDAENPYWSLNTSLKVVNRRYITSKIKAAYSDRFNTAGERIRSMVGRIKA